MVTQTSTHTPEAVWNSCLEVIRDNVNGQSYKTWFVPIIAVALEGKTLTIQVPTLFFYEWLEEHYVTLLRKTIKKELGPSAKLEYRILVDSSPGGKGHTMTVPAQNGKHDYEDESSTTYGLSVHPRNPFVIPGLKKMSIDSQLMPKLTFANFIEGECNRLGRAAGLAIASKPGNNAFNPLFLHGGVGLGKTHLAHAIGNAVKETHKSKSVLCVSAERFTSQFVDSIKQGSTQDFTHFYHMLDVLIVDDVQFLAGKKETQSMFFGIFNHLQQNGRQIILTSDRAAKDIHMLEERLLSRFKWGLSADLTVPDFETRQAIIEHKMYNDGIELPRDVVEYLAYNLNGNVRELEGALTSLLAHSTLSRREVDVVLAKDVLRDFVKLSSKELSVEHIQKLVCDNFGMNIDLMKSTTRKREIVQVRQLAMYFSKTMTKTSLAGIGKHFGGKDHSTVIHACQTVKDLMDTDQKYKSKVLELEKMLTISLK